MDIHEEGRKPAAAGEGYARLAQRRQLRSAAKTVRLLQEFEWFILR